MASGLQSCVPVSWRLLWLSIAIDIVAAVAFDVAIIAILSTLLNSSGLLGPRACVIACGEDLDPRASPWLFPLPPLNQSYTNKEEKKNAESSPALFPTLTSIAQRFRGDACECKGT